MPSKVQSIIRAATRDSGGKLNILTFPTHERYESNLCETGHNFYSIAVPGYTKPGWDIDYAEIPENYTMLQDVNNIPLLLDIDIVLSQNKYGQFGLAREVANRYNCPLISLEHTCPPNPELSPELDSSTMIQSFYQKRGTINIFISEWSRKEWGWKDNEGDVIHHGIDTDTFAPIMPIEERDNDVLSVVNAWEERDWCCGYSLWESAVKKGGFPTKVVGKNPGLSEPAVDIYDLMGKYNNSRVFFNTSIASPIPTTVLEAMSCGCAIVSTATCMIPEIIEHGKNGLISNDGETLAEYVNAVRNDVDLAKSLGEEARKTIEERFSIASFVDKWNHVFLTAEKIGDNLI